MNVVNLLDPSAVMLCEESVVAIDFGVEICASEMIVELIDYGLVI